MTNSELFKAAHKLAKETVKIAGNYAIAFKCALKHIRSLPKRAVLGVKKVFVIVTTYSLGKKVKMKISAREFINNNFEKGTKLEDAIRKYNKNGKHAAIA